MTRKDRRTGAAAETVGRTADDGHTIDSRSDAVIHVDADGRIRAINDVACRLLGWEANEIRGEPLAVVLEDGSLGAWMMQGLLETGSVVSEERTFVSKSGERIPGLCSGVVIRDSVGVPGEIACIARPSATMPDLAERMRVLETALKREQADHRRLVREVEAARSAGDREDRKRDLGRVENERQAKDQLWEWAEEELRRVQSALQHTRERLFRIEQERDDAVKQREWSDDRRRQSEDELRRVREDLQRLERHVQAAENERSADSRRVRQSAGRRLQRPGSDGYGSAREVRERYEVPNLAVPMRNAVMMQQHRDLQAGQGVDWSDALAAVDGDIELLRAVAAAFTEDSPRLLSDLRSATDIGDRKMIEHHARALKAAVKSLRAHVATQAAARLEAIAGSSDLLEAEEAYMALQLEVEKLKPALKALRDLG